jgi:hypothetical protein
MAGHPLPLAPAGNRVLRAWRLSAIGLLAAIPALAVWQGLHPPCLEYGLAAFLGVAVGLVTHLICLVLLRGGTPPFFVRLLTVCAAGLLLVLLTYLFLFFGCTETLPDHFHREILGWEMRPEAREELEGPPRKTVNQLLTEWDSETDRVYTSSSLAVMYALFLLLWVLLFVGLGVAFALVLRIRELMDVIGCYDVEGLRSRVESARCKCAEFGELAGELREHLGWASRHLTREPDRDPGSSLTKTRMALELLLISVYTTEMGKPPRKPQLGDILVDNQFTRKLTPPRIVDLLDEIRLLGNLGPHAGKNPTAKDAVLALDRLCEVIDWFAERTNVPDGKATSEGS